MILCVRKDEWEEDILLPRTTRHMRCQQGLGLRLWLFLALGIWFHMAKRQLYLDAGDWLISWDFPASRAIWTRTVQEAGRIGAFNAPPPMKTLLHPSDLRDKCRLCVLNASIERPINFFLSVNALSMSSSHFPFGCYRTYILVHSFILTFPFWNLFWFIMEKYHCHWKEKEFFFHFKQIKALRYHSFS